MLYLWKYVSGLCYTFGSRSVKWVLRMSQLLPTTANLTLELSSSNCMAAQPIPFSYNTNTMVHVLQKQLNCRTMCINKLTGPIVENVAKVFYWNKCKYNINVTITCTVLRMNYTDLSCKPVLERGDHAWQNKWNIKINLQLLPLKSDNVHL